MGIDDLFVVDPSLDVLLAHFHADAIPALVLELVLRACGVFGGVHTINGRDADEAATPAAEDERYMIASGADGKGESAEEIAAGHAPGFQFDRVGNGGELSGPAYAVEIGAEVDFHHGGLRDPFDILSAFDGHPFVR